MIDLADPGMVPYVNPYTGRVRARRRIEQAPSSPDPAVPRGTVGTLADEIDCDGLVVVDFGEPWGAVLCEPGEVKAD